MSDEQRDEHHAPEDMNELWPWAERTQHTIDFILQQQAQFSAGMERLRASQERSEQGWEQRWGRIERMWERTEESVRSLHAIAQIHEGEITALAMTQAQTALQMAETDRRMAETDRRMAETDERLNALINTVERMIAERRNGGRKEPEGADE